MPLPICQTTDPLLSFEYKVAIVKRFNPLCDYCLDPGYGRVARQHVGRSDDVDDMVGHGFLSDKWQQINGKMTSSLDGQTDDMEPFHAAQKKCCTKQSKWAYLCSRFMNCRAVASMAEACAGAEGDGHDGRSTSSTKRGRKRKRSDADDDPLVLFKSCRSAIQVYNVKRQRGGFMGDFGKIGNTDYWVKLKEVLGRESQDEKDHCQFIADSMIRASTSRRKVQALQRQQDRFADQAGNSSKSEGPDSEAPDVPIDTLALRSESEYALVPFIGGHDVLAVRSEDVLARKVFPMTVVTYKQIMHEHLGEVGPDGKRRGQTDMKGHVEKFKLMVSDLARPEKRLPTVVPVPKQCRGLCRHLSSPVQVQCFDKICADMRKACGRLGGRERARRYDCVFKCTTTKSDGVVVDFFALFVDPVGAGISGVVLACQIFVELAIVAGEGSESVMVLDRHQYEKPHKASKYDGNVGVGDLAFLIYIYIYYIVYSIYYRVYST